MKKILLSVSLLSSLISFGQTWNLVGNERTNSNTQFIGTTDANDLIFRTGNLMRLGIINSTGNLLMPHHVIISSVGGGNIGFGKNVFASNSSGASNIAIGESALASNGSGTNNVSLGHYAMAANKSGGFNIAIGFLALGATDSEANIAIGCTALQGLTSGNTNVAIGHQAGRYLSGSSNILLGTDSQAPFRAAGNVANNQLNIGNWIVGNNGVIGIGWFTTPLPSFVDINNKFRLFVKDGIRAELIQVDIAGPSNWADHVFEKDYSLMPLSDLEKFIQENKHLPNIPSAKEVVKEGINLAEMNAKLLEKIEELTLYTIEQQKQIDELKIGILGK